MLLLTLILCALALWPLAARAGLPNGDDVLYHVYRAAEMDRSWNHGVVFPHWAETFYTGYGSPVFHYYAGSTYMLTSILTRLFGWDAVNSLRALIVLAMLLGSGGMVAFVRPLAGRWGGLLAALAYTFSPYILYTEPYSRGAYPEMMAFALFPPLMALYGRLLRGGGRWTFVAAALLEALLICTHNLMALALTALLVGWLLWSAAAVLRGAGWRAVRVHGWALLALGLGVGIAAGFWLPVMLEGSAVRLGNLTGMAGVAELDYRRFFVPLSHLLAPSPRVDTSVLNGLEHQLNLGQPQVILALLGLAALLVVGRKRTAAALFFAPAALVMIVLMIPAANVIWGLVSPLTFLQFPWRFLGPIAFCLAVLVGMNGLWLERLRPHLRLALAAAGSAALVWAAAPLLVVVEWKYATVDTSAAAYQQAEVQGLQRGTTFSNEYLPRAVTVEPDPTPRLLAEYAAGYPVNRAHLETLPPETTVTLLDHGPQHDRWQVSAPADFTFEALTFDFPGWTAAVDGTTVPITPSQPHGLITFPVPAGDHTVTLRLQSTPPRDVGLLLSALAAAALLGAAWMRVSAVPQSEKEQEGERLESPLRRQFSLQEKAGAGVIAVGVALGLALLLREGGAWVQSPPDQAQLAQQAVHYALGDRIRLIGYDLNGEAFHPGDRVELRVYWTTDGNIPHGYSSFVHISTGGPPPAQADKLNPADLPTVTWPSGGSIHDDYTITLPAEIPAGAYQVYIGLYTCETRPAGDCGNGDRLTVTDADGTPVGDAVPLARITIQ
jgi:hypothetical protein